MASLTDLGGLFFQLGLLPDKNSFETGYRLIDGTVNKFSMLIGTARNAANVMQAFAVDAGKTDSALYKTSMRLGVTAETLSTWKAAARIAGVSADGLVASMEELNYALHNEWSEGLDKYAKQLGKIGMGLDDLRDKEGNFLTGDKAVKKILEYTLEQYNAAETDEAKMKIGYALSDALGESMFDLFAELVRTGMSVDELLADAGKTQFQTDESMNKGSNFIKEWNTFKESISSISGLLGDEVGGALTEAMQKVNEWLGNNGDAIKNAVDNIAALVADIANSNIMADIGKLISAMIKLIGGDFKGAKEDLTNTSGVKAAKASADIYSEIAEWKTDNGIKGNPKWEDLPLNIQQDLIDYWKTATGIGAKTWIPGNIDFLSANSQRRKSLKDGIMRPDGTVTQVAPDDWVFAARNLGDLARAFIPQNAAAGHGAMEFSIVQNFTINGSSDLPQVLRQQAYNGTQEGLMQVMAQSSRRLQLMSGTR